MPAKRKQTNTKAAIKKASVRKPRKQATVSATQGNSESDGVYFLKIVLYVVLGTLWLKFGQPLMLGSFELNALPLGLLIGLIIINFDRFQVDRKIEYAILVVVTVMSYFLPAGILI